MNTNDSTNAQSQDIAAAKPLGMLAHQIEMPKDNSPAWKFVDILKSPPIGPDEAKVIIEARPVPGNLHKPGTSPAIKAAIATGAAGNTVGGPASIVELARALRNDVDLIYEWVFNNIETLPNYGLHKGALGALLDGFGTAFDQSDLLVKLLRQAGYTANYVTGTLSMDAANLGAWLGTDTTNVFASYNMLIGSGTPVALVFPNLEFSHCWVECTIGGTIYTFDPARKTYTTKSKIDLATAMGYNQATFLSRANTGATITADYVQNMNRANIRADLDTFSNNLVSWIKTNNHGAGLDDILGGRNIVQNDAAVPTRQIGNPFLKSGSTPTVWTALPQSLKATMGTVFDTINVTFNTEDLAGKRLTLFWNASHQAELRLDGTLLATSSARAVGASTRLDLTITHPYAVTWYNTINAGHFIVTDKPHLICNSFGAAGRGASQFHSRRMKANLAAGMATTDEAVFGELLGTTWKMWDASQNKVADITNRLTNCTTMYHHQCGVMGWYDTPLTNLGAVVAATAALDNNYTQRDYNDTVIAMHGVALEAQIFNQFANMDGVSTTPLVDIASSAGQKIYDAKTANWLSTVKPALVNYSAGTLSDIEFFVNTLGERVGVPENGSITRGSWVGYGYYRIPTFGTFGIIGGALKGGGGSQPNTINDWVSGANTDSNGNPSPTVGQSGNGGGMMGGGNSAGNGNANNTTSSEPIDMFSGDYLLEQADITIGSQKFPYGLGFTRSYNSSSRFNNGPLGLGWTHNFQIMAQKATDGLMGLGSHSILGAAAAIAEIFVAVDVQSDLSKPFSKYLTCTLSSQWFIDNLTNNGVLVTHSQKSLMFVKLRDGSFTPPKGSNATVILNVDGTYKYKTLSGSTINFNNLGLITTWVEPYGMTVSFSYTGAQLNSISNGLGRTLTLSYSGSGLTSVSDGTGRSILYNVNASKNLVTVTDPNSKVWTYEYDLPGRMTKFYQPANPTVAVVTNTFDTLDRVKDQKDFLLNTWQYFFAGSRSQEVNPLGDSNVRYFNGFGNCIKSVDNAGKKFIVEVDGRERVTKRIAPEGNSVLLSYDALDRLVTTVIKPKPGSPLADITKSATYDPVWKKLKTQTDGLGNTITYNYDPSTGSVLSVVYPFVSGVGAASVSYTYNSRGQVLAVTKPDGSVNQNTYDPATENLLNVVCDFGVGRLNLQTSMTYNSRGDIISMQDPLGRTTSVDYDILRRPIQRTTPAPFSRLTKLTYDDNSNAIKCEVETGDPIKPWQIAQCTYDADNKLSSKIDDAGNQSTVQYDSLRRLWKTFNGIGSSSTMIYDAAHRVISVLDGSGATAVSQTYSDNGRQLTLTDARGYTTDFVYDGFDRPIKTIYPDSTSDEVLTYDKNGNCLSAKQRSGVVVAATYDELNRLKTRTVTGYPTVTTTHDLSGRCVSRSVPVVVGDPSTGTLNFAYDAVGRFVQEQYPSGLSVTHVRDGNGNIVKTTYPDGYFVEKVYDELDRLKAVRLNGSLTNAVAFEYDNLYRRSKIVYENGVVTTFSYESDGFVCFIRHNFTNKSVEFRYKFDASGQMTQQLMSDPANFRWTPGAPATENYGIASNLNQYPSVNGLTQTYAVDGCLTNDGLQKYEYNGERMLTAVRNAATNALIAQYSYDPLLRQTQKVVGATKTRYYYSGLQRLSDYDGTTNTLQKRYVYGDSLDEVLLSVDSSGVKTYFHSNHQQSVVATTDATGILVNTYKYGPFGQSGTSLPSSHGFTGQRYDAESGLYYFKMRHYSPSTGRFLQPDPIGYSDGLNLYSFARNLPLSRTDATGLSSGQSGSPSYTKAKEQKRQYGDGFGMVWEETSYPFSGAQLTWYDKQDSIQYPTFGDWIAQYVSPITKAFSLGDIDLSDPWQNGICQRN